MVFLSDQDIAREYEKAPTPSNWTAIIPAAGTGTRLGYHKPKILYPIAGRAILDWLIDLLEPHCAKLVFSLSPTSAKQVVPILAQKLSQKYDTAVLDSRGMADSIFQAVSKVTTPYIIVIWGDQPAIQPETLQKTMRIQEYNAEAKLTLPIVERGDPYVHYENDAEGRFVKVLERREGASMPRVGRSDCGLFAFRTNELRSVFLKEVEKGIALSEGTKEWNFLPMLPQFDTDGTGVYAIGLVSMEESIGVNDTSDAARLETFLKGRVQL